MPVWFVELGKDKRLLVLRELIVLVRIVERDNINLQIRLQVRVVLLGRSVRKVNMELHLQHLLIVLVRIAERQNINLQIRLQVHFVLLGRSVRKVNMELHLQHLLIVLVLIAQMENINLPTIL